MILDHIDNWRLYTMGSPLMRRAFDWITTEFDPAMEDGRIDLAGDDCYAMIQTNDTKPMGKCRFEAHRVYLDIQYVFAGAEIMGWAPLDSLEINEPYDATRDVEFLEQPERFTPLEVTPGIFAIFFPGDAHEPLVRMLSEKQSRKIVVKVRIDRLFS